MEEDMPELTEFASDNDQQMIELDASVLQGQIRDLFVGGGGGAGDNHLTAQVDDQVY